jgi:hypothetical protein
MTLSRAIALQIKGIGFALIIICLSMQFTQAALFALGF